MVPVLCSPSTGQTLVLPKVETSRAKVKCLLGYDPLDKQFKELNSQVSKGHSVLPIRFTAEQKAILIQSDDEAQVQQKPISVPAKCSLPHFYPRDEICVNGVLYYTSLYKACMIVCFDVRSEKFNLIEVKGASVRRAVLGFMVNCNGKLGFSMSENHEGNVGFISGKSSRFKLWVLEDVEKQECSGRVYVLPAEWKNIVGEHVLKFVGLSRTNEIVLSSWYSVKPFYLFYFNPGRNTVVRVEIEGVDMDGSKFAVL
ncbi:hypothetical protein F2Q69_00034687 [Brassica cretica]|uniref:F-box associated beta-propeller type 3 domain-containing protein n=1 Tax=Brassica cretica TaxID=69181 RepID=A0A8S9SFX0_BRACR|nr:hypothetical protein F2Q69_00034687 [Brassica cretica]